MTMTPFLDYLRESPHETEAVVPVTLYLQRRPLLGYQSRIPSIIAAVRTGAITPTQQTVTVNELFPTQTTVNQLKVIAYSLKDLADDKPPLVLQDDQFGYVIIDGHHRICGVACRDACASLVVHLITVDQLNHIGLLIP